MDNSLFKEITKSRDLFYWDKIRRYFRFIQMGLNFLKYLLIKSYPGVIIINSLNAHSVKLRLNSICIQALDNTQFVKSIWTISWSNNIIIKKVKFLVWYLTVSWMLTCPLSIKDIFRIWEFSKNKTPLTHFVGNVTETWIQKIWYSSIKEKKYVKIACCNIARTFYKSVI